MPELPTSPANAQIQTLEARVAELEAQLTSASAQHAQAQAIAEHNYTTLLRGPFVIFRWIAAEGWPVEAVSENVQALFGYSADDFLQGRIAFANTIYPDDLGRVFDEVMSYSASGVPNFEQEYRICHRNGSVHWIYDFTTVVRDEGGTITHYYGYVLDITARKALEEQQLQLQQQIITAQQASLEELSTPLLPVSDNAVVMPLVGMIDSRRAQQVIEVLLTGISEHGASIAILDITGVRVVDTQVARALIHAAQAAKLLGTQVVITGMHPEVAQTLVQLGVELQGLISMANLQGGIGYALRQESRHR